ncbi:MAG: PD40 domain-containing protein [Chloroflexi bacterium]|nr:PD40 domain-containing protein [Chloroflexota bacterium]
MTRLLLPAALLIWLLCGALIGALRGLGSAVPYLELVYGEVLGARFILRFLDVEHGLSVIQVLEGEPSALSWSPDGARLAVTLLDRGDLWTNVFALDGTSHALRQVANPMWVSPTQLLVRDGRRNGALSVFDLSQPVPTAQPVQLPFDRPFYAPLLAADGRWLAFLSITGPAVDLYIAQLNSGDPARLLAQNNSGMDYAWSPDSQTLVYTLSPAGSYELYSVDMPSGAVHALTEGYDNNVLPNWSPDGRLLAYISGNTRKLLRLLDSAGGVQSINLSALVGSMVIGTSELGWSPDGRMLALGLSIVQQPRTDMYLLTLNDTPTLRRVSSGGAITAPAWRPQ